MKITEGLNTGGNIISAYGADGVVINQIAYRGSLLVSADVLEAGWLVSSFDALGSEKLEEILAHQPEVVLLGTGARAQFPPPPIREFFLSRRVGLEVMTTAAACRTYNLLVEDGRRVLAVLML